MQILVPSPQRLISKSMFLSRTNLETIPATTGGKIQASIGPYGPYIVHDQGKEGKDYRSLKTGDSVLTITLERALEILSEPKKGRRTSSNSKQALRELGSHPNDAEPVNIYNGPYGPYVKHGKTNVGLPEGQSVEDMTLDKAVELLATKESSSKSTRRKSSTAASSNGKSATTTKKKAATGSSRSKTSASKSKAKT